MWRSGGTAGGLATIAHDPDAPPTPPIFDESTPDCGLVAREALRLIGAKGRLAGIEPSAGMMREMHLSGVELAQGFADELPRELGIFPEYTAVKPAADQERT